ncbi:MAG TPA: aldehyde dehydrogenase family protein [Candidatus Baltobacteraceae bacterium]|nr:aldehyde dehydrogenase family protein [Candidatus Baltobacteraceae bacterium]
MSTVLPSFEYAPALESTAPVEIRDRYGLFIGGEWLAATSGAVFPTINPATEQTLSEVAAADAGDVDKAVRAARRGYEKYWRKLRPAERAKYIFRIARAISERSREFALLETLDGGKPIRESRDFDVPQAAAHFFYHAGWADKLAWAIRSPERARALGVVGAIVPWNFPLLIASWKLAPALACGNTVVLKPAETTPLSALLLAEVCAEAELPPGVVNIVTGDGRTGAALVEHPDVDKLSFTGSTEVGKQIRRATAGTRTRLSLELGGKSAVLVYEDAPLDQAIEGIVNAIFFNQGHVCCAGSRLLVQESVYEDVVERLRARLETLRHGDPLDKNTDIGAINSRRQRDAISDLVKSGVEEGATLVQASAHFPERGFWFPASFFLNVQPTYRVAREEIFGPVLSVMSFRTPDEAIERANNLPYGLSAGIWTSSGQLALYTAQRLAAGVIWCNTFNQFDPSSPFGGYKESGFGREGGLTGLREYLDL